MESWFRIGSGHSWSRTGGSISPRDDTISCLPWALQGPTDAAVRHWLPVPDKWGKLHVVGWQAFHPMFHTSVVGVIWLIHMKASAMIGWAWSIRILAQACWSAWKVSPPALNKIWQPFGSSQHVHSFHVVWKLFVAATIVGLAPHFIGNMDTHSSSAPYQALPLKWACHPNDSSGFLFCTSCRGPNQFGSPWLNFCLVILILLCFERLHLGNTGCL